MSDLPDRLNELASLAGYYSNADVSQALYDAADRIRELEDAVAHWEHKYATARQYNRNLEERIRALLPQSEEKPQCTYCFGTKFVEQSDGSNRPCNYCNGTGNEPPTQPDFGVKP